MIGWRRKAGVVVECPVCGMKNPKKNRFCDHCGAEINNVDVPVSYDVFEIEEPEKKKRPSEKGLMYVLGCTAVMVTVIIVTTLAMVILGEWMAINYILVEYVCLFCIQCILALFLVVLCIVALVRKKQSILLSSLCLFGTLTLLSYPIVATLGNHYITISFWVICFYYLLSVIGSVLMLISPEKKKKQ